MTAGALLAACAPAPPAPTEHHLGSHSLGGRPSAQVPSGDDPIPATVGGANLPPRPRGGPKLEVYSVVVSQVEIAELLFAMARDAKINVDVHPAVRGKVTLNAVNQTLPQILSRLAKQVDLRYEFDGKNLVVLPDAPFVRHYTVDYVNMARDSRSTSSISTQIASTGRDALSSAGGSGAQATNNSTTVVTNYASNRFWDTLASNLRQLIAETSPAAERGDAGQAERGGAEGTGRGAKAAGSGPSTSGPTGAGAASGNGSAGGGAGAGGIAGSAAGASGNAQGGATTAMAGAAGNGGSAANERTGPVIVSAETGVLTVFATQRQHERVRQYLDRVLSAARRQVMIEATIVEVQLSDEFQQGVNWSRLRADGSGWAFQQQPLGSVATLPGGATPNTGPGGIVFPGTVNATGALNSLPGNALAAGGQLGSMGVLRYLNSTSTFGNIGAAVSLLQSFGKVKVLSSPKISVLNNQTAMLKVVDNRVYFTINVQTTPGAAGSAPVVTYSSTPNTVPVGFVMSVTPQIDEAGAVTISVRPTISRIIGYVNDPNPQLAQFSVTSRIPEIQTREMESILKVGSGDVAVMGGLMQDSVSEQQDGVPGAAGLPVLGNLFKYRSDATRKSELLIFMRPIVIRDASMEGDYRTLKDLLPGDDFFSKPVAPTVPRAWQRDPLPVQRRSAPAGTDQ